MENVNLFEYISEKYSNNEGFSISIRNGISNQQSKRYILSLTDNEIKKPLDLILSIDAFRRIGEYINCDNVYIGGWASEGKYYLDLSVDTDSLEQAQAVAKMFKQRAIWDSVQEVSISVE